MYFLGLELWRDNVVRNRVIFERLLAILIDLVSRERQGEVVERSLIKVGGGGHEARGAAAGRHAASMPSLGWALRACW